MRKDEQLEQFELDKKVERAQQAEREARLTLLRKRANVICADEDTISPTSSSPLVEKSSNVPVKQLP